MTTSISTEIPADRAARCLPIPGGKVLAYVGRRASSLRAVAIGLVLAIGSCGLILGGFTVAVSSVLVRNGLDLLSAMTIGFFATGFVGAALGVYIAMRAVRTLAGDLSGDD